MEFSRPGHWSGFPCPPLWRAAIRSLCSVVRNVRVMLLLLEPWIPSLRCGCQCGKDQKTECMRSPQRCAWRNAELRVQQSLTASPYPMTTVQSCLQSREWSKRVIDTRSRSEQTLSTHRTIWDEEFLLFRSSTNRGALKPEIRLHSQLLRSNYTNHEPSDKLLNLFIPHFFIKRMVSGSTLRGLYVCDTAPSKTWLPKKGTVHSSRDTGVMGTDQGSNE